MVACFPCLSPSVCLSLSVSPEPRIRDGPPYFGAPFLYMRTGLFKDTVNQATRREGGQARGAMTGRPSERNSDGILRA